MRTVAFHIHSSSSYDCLASSRSLLRRCRRQGIQTLCITDHDTLQGSLRTAALAGEYGIQAITGGEYFTEIGDVIGLFLREEITTRKPIALLQAIKEQGGISILPHPFQSHTLNDEFLEKVDIIEAFNSRCSEKQNAQAFELAQRLHKPMVAGADAHFAHDISDCVMTFSRSGELSPEDFLTVSRSWSASPTPPLHMRLSQITKAVKTSDPPLMYRSLRSFAYTTLHEVILSRQPRQPAIRNEWKGKVNG